MSEHQQGGTDSPALRIIRPRQRQVIQRNEGLSSIRIEGTCAAGGDRIEARLVPAPGASGRRTPWQALRAEGLPGEFCGRIDAPAGGWYELQLRLRRGPESMAEARVQRVGVGEVFVAAGQSNAANYGDATLRAGQDRAVAYGNRHWHPAADPMPGATGEGGSPWCPFADLLVGSLDLPVAVASVAVGGASMASWMPGGENHPRLKQVLEELGPGGVRAVLWHQGETDNGNATTAEAYYAGMKRIIEATASQAGRPIPWFVARASFIPVIHKPPPVLSDAVREAQGRLWRDGLAFAGPDTDDLVGPKYRSADEIHFSRDGLIAHGQRWFAMVFSQLFAAQPLPRPQAVISGIVPRQSCPAVEGRKGS